MKDHDRLCLDPLDFHRVRREAVRTLLALELHEREIGRYPASLDELVPKYLPDPPHDVMSGQPFVYRVAPDGKSFRLYALGYDAVDNGGTPAAETTDALTRKGSGFDYIIWPLP